MSRRSPLVATFLLLSLGAASPAVACDEKVCTCFRESRVNGWQMAESERFRIHYVGKSIKAAELVTVCERTCQDLRELWLGATEVARWTPKCDVYLYPSGSEFERRTRVPAAAWGFADLAVGDGRVWSRALHMRNDDSKRQARVLVHEMTHVVLAEHFVNEPIPRWADEGIAVLSEPPERRESLMELLADEAAKRRLMPIKDLTRLSEIPRDPRQSEIFYAQSGALVDYLVKRKKMSGTEVLKLVEDSRKRGWDTALKKQYPKLTATAFETGWRDWVLKPDDEKAAAKEADDSQVEELASD